MLRTPSMACRAGRRRLQRPGRCAAQREPTVPYSMGQIQRKHRAGSAIEFPHTPFSTQRRGSVHFLASARTTQEIARQKNSGFQHPERSARIYTGGYELAWDPAILSTLRIKTRDRIAFGNEFLLGFDLWPIWNTVRCPTLVLRGSRSTVLSATTAKRMRKSGPRAKVIDIEGVGHAPWLMSEDQIRIVRDFLLSSDDST